MVNVDQYASVGYALELMVQSEYHRQRPLGVYFRTAILPSLRAQQARFYLTPEGVPTAMVTWAWLSDAVEAEVHATGRALSQDEWSCGDRLFFNDWITPYGNTREVLNDLLNCAFRGVTVATSLERNPDASVRRINRWTGFSRRPTKAVPAA